MYGLILIITAAVVPGVTAGPALAGPATDAVRVAVGGVQRSAVSLPPSVGAARRTIPAWQSAASLEASPVVLGSEPAPQTGLAPRTVRHVGTTPRTVAARAPPLPVGTD